MSTTSTVSVQASSAEEAMAEAKRIQEDWTRITGKPQTVTPHKAQQLTNDPNSWVVLIEETPGYD